MLVKGATLHGYVYYVTHVWYTCEIRSVMPQQCFIWSHICWYCGVGCCIWENDTIMTDVIGHKISLCSSKTYHPTENTRGPCRFAVYHRAMHRYERNKDTWGRLNIKMSSYQYRKSHCGDKTISRPSYLHNGISYTDKITSLYWIRTLLPGVHLLTKTNWDQRKSPLSTPIYLYITRGFFFYRDVPFGLLSSLRRFLLLSAIWHTKTLPRLRGLLTEWITSAKVRWRVKA